MHPAAGLAPLVIGFPALRVVLAGHGPALDMLGAAGDLHSFGRVGFKLEQPARHVQAVGVFLGQAFVAKRLTVGVGLIRRVDRRQRALES